MRNPEDPEPRNHSAAREEFDLIRFGFPETCREFMSENRSFFKVYHEIERLCEKVFIRDATCETLTDRLIFQLGRLVVEDFMEILLVVCNGYGEAGLKLLRGMYERLVNLSYILDDKAPESRAKLFFDFYWILRSRDLKHLKGISPEHFKRMQSLGTVDEIVRECKRVLPNYQKGKGRQSRLPQQWSGLDLRSMARKVDLEGLYYLCYSLPSTIIHGTPDSLVRRIKIRDGILSFNEGAQMEAARLALLGAHHCLLKSLAHQNEYFRLGLEEDLEIQGQRFEECWGNLDAGMDENTFLRLLPEVDSENG